MSSPWQKTTSRSGPVMSIDEYIYIDIHEAHVRLTLTRMRHNGNIRYIVQCNCLWYLMTRQFESCPTGQQRLYSVFEHGGHDCTVFFLSSTGLNFWHSVTRTCNLKKYLCVNPTLCSSHFATGNSYWWCFFCLDFQNRKHHMAFIGIICLET